MSMDEWSYMSHCFFVFMHIHGCICLNMWSSCPQAPYFNLVNVDGFKFDLDVRMRLIETPYTWLINMMDKWAGLWMHWYFLLYLPLVWTWFLFNHHLNLMQGNFLCRCLRSIFCIYVQLTILENNYIMLSCIIQEWLLSNCEDSRPPFGEARACNISQFLIHHVFFEHTPVSVANDFTVVQHIHMCDMINILL